MFKLQKNTNSKSILTKNMHMVKGGYRKFNKNLLLSSFFTATGIVLVEYIADVTDNKIIHLIGLSICPVILYESLLPLYDVLREYKSTKKITYLNELLKEKKLDIDLFSDYMLTVHSDKINNTFKAEINFFNGKKILSDNDKTFFYVDNDKQINITNEVNSTLSKKKSKQSK